MPYNEQTEQYELSELEKEFERVREIALPLIEEKLAEAKRCVREAVQLSEEYGVPFDSYLNEAPNTYVPSSMSEKYKIELENEEALEHFGYYFEYGSTGWQKSFC